MGYLRQNNTMKLKDFLTPSFIVVILIFLFCVFTAHVNKVWCGDGFSPYCYDMKQYYSYLPKFFLEHDMAFENRGDYWLDALPNGRVFVKYTSGLAILQGPFFLLAWGFSNLFNISLEGGYSKVFIEFIHYGIFIYFLLGLLSLRKVLMYFKFSELVISITLLATFFGTNLFNYILGQGLMTHGFLFSLHCMFLYLIIKFYDKQNYSASILLGLVGGLIALIRPTEVVCFIVWILWDVNSIASFKSRVMLLLGNFKLLFVMAIIFVLVWIPQIIYWHYVSGNFFIDAYAGEKLFFSDPKIIKVLFSARNGLLPYCPVLFLYFVSLFVPNSTIKGKLGVLIFVVLNVYIVSCWWCWWYGGSYSMRALIQIYPYLALSFAGMLQYIYSRSKFRNVVKYTLNAVILLLVLVQIKFWRQYKEGYVHYDSMTSKAYFFTLTKFEMDGAEKEMYYSLLRAPDYVKAKEGIR
jgi:hypothetical protein